MTSTHATIDRLYLAEGEADKASSSSSTDARPKDTSLSAAEKDTTGLSKKAILQLKLKRKILELDEGGLTHPNLSIPNLSQP